MCSVSAAAASWRAVVAFACSSSSRSVGGGGAFDPPQPIVYVDLERLQAELEKVAAEKDAAVAHQKELQDALDAANKQLKKESIVIASKDEFIKTLIQTPAAA